MSAVNQPRVDERIVRLRLQRVMHDFGETLTVTTLDEESFRVSTPFFFTNGDMFPIMIETRETGWRLTDRGGTIANQTRGHAQLTDHQIDLIKAIAHPRDFTLSNSHHISVDLDDLPTPRHIADLIQLQARISELP
jgi:Domain of unknown function DUF1828